MKCKECKLVKMVDDFLKKKVSIGELRQALRNIQGEMNDADAKKEK